MMETGMRRTFITFILLLFPFVSVFAQKVTNRDALSQLSETFQQQLEAHRTTQYYRLLTSSNPAARALNRDPNIALMYIDDYGMPVYYRAHNLNAARTIGTDRVWPGGDTGHDLTGRNTVAGQLGIWDVGLVLDSHPEFSGRVTQRDTPADTSFHSTAVAGTMIAAGISPEAQGMSYEAVLSAYDWNHDHTEMANAAANGMIVSNHSYGRLAGWDYAKGRWYWYGLMKLNMAEDYKHGFYSPIDRALDLISYHAPYYLIVISAGNDRTDLGPKDGEGHYHWSDGDWVWSSDWHKPDGAGGGYDTLPGRGPAKNILTVGAVEDIPDGYTEPGDVVQSSFSSWGPTDDGRVKPDIVANGVDLITLSSYAPELYDTLSGTSLAAPSVAGSANLLANQYRAIHGDYPRSATLKALILFGADEAGEHDGPDYRNGWGVMNTATSANAIVDAAGIVESALANKATEMFAFTVDSSEDVRVTTAWTDRAGPVLEPAVDSRRRILANDLDVRIEHIATQTLHEPWTLSVTDPAAPAERRDNAVDNVEQIDINDAPPGRYRVIVTHKRSLRGEQAYSLVASRAIDRYVVSSYHARWVGSAVEIIWTMGTDGDYSYDVARSTAPSGPFVKLPMAASENGNTVSYRDESAEQEKKYTYRVSILEMDVVLARFDAIVVTPPYPLYLSQNYPNPFALETRFDYSLDRQASVSLRVYDVAGQLVRTLVDGERSTGRYTNLWDGRDAAGERVAAGVYFCRLRTDGQTLVRKIVCVR